MRVSNPSRKFFYFFEILSTPESESERLQKNCFQGASKKYDQYHFCFEKLKEVIDSARDGSDIRLDDSLITAIDTYLDGFIIFSRAAADKATKGLLSSYGVKGNIDTVNRLVRKLKEGDEEKYGLDKLESIEHWRILKAELESEFSWAKALFGEKNSLRNFTVHEKSIQYSSVSSMDSDAEVYINTGERIDAGNGLYPEYVPNLISYLTEILNGVDALLTIIRDDVYKKRGFSNSIS